MSKWLGAAALMAAMAFSASAADTAYSFNAQNASGGNVAVKLDGKVVCMLKPGGICPIGIDDGDPHQYSFSINDGPWTDFQPGNLELVVDAAGAHCTDPTGAATN